MAFRSGNSATASSNGTTIVVSAPAGVALNDIIVLMVATDGNDDTITVSWPTGFTQIRQQNVNVSWESEMYTAWKLATGSEPGTYTATFSGSSTSRLAAIGCWSGRDTSSPIEASGGNTSTASGTTSNTATANAITVTNGADLIFCSFHDWDNSQASASWTPPSGMTEAADLFTGTWLTGTMAYQDNLSAGSTGSKSATTTWASTTNDHGPGSVLISLKVGASSVSGHRLCLMGAGN